MLIFFRLLLVPDSRDCKLNCTNLEFCYDILFGSLRKEACLCQYGFMATGRGCEGEWRPLVDFEHSKIAYQTVR